LKYRLIPSQYEIEPHPPGYNVTFKLETRGKWSDGTERWVIKDMAEVLNKDGNWEFEPSPSNRSTDFLERTRYTFEEATAMLNQLYCVEDVEETA